MTKTAENTPLQLAAQLCYRLLCDSLDETDIPLESLTALQSVAGSPLTAEELLQVTHRLRNHHSFASVQTHLMTRWSSQLEPVAALNDEDALEFLRQLFSSMDHAALYDHAITVNTTVQERDSASSVETRYSGNMPCWTLHLTLDGTGLLINDHMEVQVKRGDMMLFHPQARYHSGLHPVAQSWKHVWVLFQPRSHWSEWLDWQSGDEGIMVLSLPDEDCIALMEALFSALLALRDEPPPLQSDLQYIRLEEILLRASVYDHATPTKSLDTRVQRACDYMQAHLTGKFKIEDVAKACNLSSSRLAHLFKGHMGVSPKSWSNSLRLQMARKLLLADDASISDIAQAVGYEDPNQFTRYFSKNLGCSPREFRRLFQGNASTVNAEISDSSPL